MGLVLTDQQWEQASLPVKQSGLGLCRAADVADASYISSRHGAFDDCVGLDRHHAWDDGAGGHMQQPISRRNAMVPVNAHFVFGAGPR